MILRIEKISYIIVVATYLSISIFSQQVQGFHLSFGNRIIRSFGAPAPQLNPASSLIRPIECRNANNHSEAGICMFSIDCMQNKGVPLSICKHNYFVGTCCKLPDHNNFVGIVYDLRETDNNNHVLEARKVSGSTSAGTTIQTPPPTSIASSTSKAQASELASSIAPFPTIPATNSPVISLATEALPQISDAPALNPHIVLDVSLGEKEKSKYVISSTNLFPSTGSPASTANSGSTSSEQRTSPSVESARNADGSPPNQQQIAQPNGKLQIELDSFQIQQTTLAAPQQQRYELLGGASNASELDIEPVSTLSSAHSASPGSAQQQFNTHQKPEVERPQSVPERPAGGESGTLEELNRQESVKESVVLANNHQVLGSTLRSPTGEQSPSSDQEFSLSSSSSSTSKLPESSLVAKSEQQNSTSSPFVDLVSSQSSQTTTPFTTSLSTALIPSLSPQTLQPTSAPASASSTVLVSSQAATGTSGSPTTSSSQTRPASASTPKPPSTSSSELSSSLSQLYTSLQPSLATSASSSSSPSRPNYHNILPAFHSMASSKIVTGSSATNNLIPGLSGLQSAIFSHIPFKLASGLSSGLSSYLQAAMKPSNGAGRPLISSNTAPAQHYQQNLLNSSSLAKPPATGVRFPGGAAGSSGGGSPSSSSTESIPAGSPETSGFKLSQAASSAAPPELLARETQQVCGRPQVKPEEVSSKKRVARIVGGNQSSFGQWPWMVSLRQWRKGAFLHKCGAALLNENWAITAAHCVENVKPSDLLLRLGEFDVSNQEEPYPYIERRVKSVVSHPSFDSKTFEYDLALLRFAEPIKYERNVLPVCVPTGNDSYVDRMATVIGWGRLFEDGPLPDIIQHVDVPIITNNECEKMYKNAGYIEEIPDMFICAGISKGGRDSCEGDSGGPLTMVDHDGRSYLVGIISWGIGCALPSQPGVYTRITAFSGWINQITAS